MSKLVKLTNNTYLSSESIIHKRGGGNYYLSNLLDNIYPIGSIFLTTNITNPSTYFGGEWERMSGGYLYAVVNNKVSNSSYTGTGAQSHVLTINEIPSHNHNIWGAIDGGSDAGDKDRIQLNGWGTSRWWPNMFKMGNSGGVKDILIQLPILEYLFGKE